MAGQTWAPQSPDLSGYAPQSPDLSGYTQPHNPAPTSNWAGPQSPDLTAFTSQEHVFQEPAQGFSLDNNSWIDQPPQTFDNFAPQHQLGHLPQQFEFAPPTYPAQQIGAVDPMPQTRGQKLKTEETDTEWAPQTPAVKQPSGRGRKPKVEGGSAAAPPVKKMDTHGVEVKTKFPTARIKRIMQADEDVGKVAQVTPVVMAKALELFMIRLITSSAGIARSRGSKRVLTPHMKAAVMQDEQFDNLREIVGKIPDAPVKGAAADDDDEPAEGSGKKRKKAAAGGAKGKKRRNSDDEDF